jgi:hypothetical protein
MSIILDVLTLFLLSAPNALAQSPPEHSTLVNTVISTTVDSLKITKNGFQVAISYVSHLKEPILVTLTYPPSKSGFAADNLGNEYILVNSTGMVRKHEDPNLDISRPDLATLHSTFLLVPPNTKVSASFLFKRATESATDRKDKPSSIMLSIGYYARPAEKFDQNVSRAFTFTTTITDAKAD